MSTQSPEDVVADNLRVIIDFASYMQNSPGVRMLVAFHIAKTEGLHLGSVREAVDEAAAAIYGAIQGHKGTSVNVVDVADYFAWLAHWELKFRVSHNTSNVSFSTKRSIKPEIWEAVQKVHNERLT